jgi:sensor c-di-GMP phosphodiesterase-like protein
MSPRGWLRLLTIASAAVTLSQSLVHMQVETPNLQERFALSAGTRRQWIDSTAAATLAAYSSSFAALTAPAHAASPRIADEDLKRIVTSDLLDNQFLVTGKLTPEVYLKDATFTDEIDTYGMDQWMKGTQKLFVGEGSQVRLVGDVQVSPEAVEFRFDEDLMFRIPFRPVVKLSGRLVLTRDKETGLISSYREYWDQDAATVLKSAKF